jgi:hypothetical protein
MSDEGQILKKWKKLPEEVRERSLARILQKASGKVLEPIDLDELVESLGETKTDNSNMEEK